MRHLGVDHGNRRIGIAISDEFGLFARPLCIHEHISREKDAEIIVHFAEEKSCEVIVIGMPLDSDGSIGPRARSVGRFIDQVKSQTNTPVISWDESNSTQKAILLSIQRGERPKDRKAPMDDQAAAIILQDYLDSINYIKTEQED